ncbi:hypothetical protein Q3G72_006650 [Acer saccharum]|nr:hypothetical protein Q3G72_006650 [Acer saccharum]
MGLIPTEATRFEVVVTNGEKLASKGLCKGVRLVIQGMEEIIEDGPLRVLLENHANLFTELKGLPPSKDKDHRIPMMAGSGPVNVRPYR